MRVDQTYTYHCDIANCGETETQHVEDVYAMLLPAPVVPPGWVQVAHLLFCPLHSLFLHVDGQEVSLEQDEPEGGA